MTSEEFRSDPDLLKWMRELSEHQYFRFLLEAMRSLHPVVQTAPRGVSPTDASIMLGEQTGWEMYERLMLSHSRPITKDEPLPEPDYPDEPEPAES